MKKTSMNRGFKHNMHNQAVLIRQLQHQMGKPYRSSISLKFPVKKKMSYPMAWMKHGLRPFGNIDRDSVPNVFDCRPFDLNKHMIGYIKDEYSGKKLKKGPLLKISKAYFGLTDDPREAGYILPEGEMLDFSGKRFGGSGGVRHMDHRDIQNVMDEGGSEAMMKFQSRERAIRFSYSASRGGSLNVDVVRKPSTDQIQKLKQVIREEQPEELIIERTHPESGESIKVVEKDYPEEFDVNRFREKAFPTFEKDTLEEEELKKEYEEEYVGDIEEIDEGEK